MNLSSGVLTVSKVLKKTNSSGFKDLQVGDQIEIFSELDGKAIYTRQAPFASVFNHQTGETFSKYFSQVGKDVRNFEFEGFIKLEEDKE